MTLPFPLVLTFNKKIEFDSFNDEQINLLTNQLESKTVNIIKTNEKFIEFDVPLFRSVSNLNIMGPVDHGQLSIKSIHGKMKSFTKFRS